jgi:RNA polymerase-interacting CarD/CdnL/TRCF family regulator
LSTASPSRKSPLHAAVGDMVVCAAHGVGRVVAHEQNRVGGTERDCVVIDLAAGLRITLPLQETAARLRAVAGERELEDVRSRLASRPSRRDKPWTKRVKESKAKLAAGLASELAEVVRTGIISSAQRTGCNRHTRNDASTFRRERSSCASCAPRAE